MPNLNFNHDTLLLIFIGVTAAAFLFQVLLLLGVLLAVRKGMKQIRQEMESLRSTVAPLVDGTQQLLTRVAPAVESAANQVRQTLVNVGPKFESTMSDLAEIAGQLRVETEKIQETTLEIVGKVRAQSGRIDELLTSLLDSLFRFGERASEAINKPLRQFQGFAASIKSALESLNAAVPPRQQPNDPNRHL